MRWRNAFLWCISCLSLYFPSGYCQETSTHSELYDFPDKVVTSIIAKSRSLEQKLDNQTKKYLSRFARQEKKIQEKLLKKDSIVAKELFAEPIAYYAALRDVPVIRNSFYSGHMDSVLTALHFIEQNNLFSRSPVGRQQIRLVFETYASLQDKLTHANHIKQYLKERQQQLKQQLEKFGLTKEFRKFQKEVYYYRAQIDEYRNALEDPSKLEAKLLQLVNKIPAFKEFFNKHSVLASMFRLPGNQVAGGSMAGLQTRAMIQQELENRFGSGPDVNRAMQQNFQSAQSQLNTIKQKITQLGQNGDDLDLPNFKPNTQKTKSFLQRIELGVNVQSTKSNNFFPVTSDLAFTAGYKLNDKSIIGLGASYKLGWGQNIRHIKITHEGIGFRSFLDWKLKSSFYASGGFEYNYQQAFTTVQQLQVKNKWQQSGLAGISKIVSVNNKFFKKTKVQLLWDFLSYQQIPRTQP